MDSKQVQKNYLAELLRQQPAALYVDLEDPENEDFQLQSGIIESNLESLNVRISLVYYEYDSVKANNDTSEVLEELFGT